MDEAATINALMESLKFFRDQYLSSAYSTMGFTAIAAGWLITSRSARLFLHSHRWLGLSSLFLIVLTYIGYWRMSLGVQTLSQIISDKLSMHSAAQGLYEHYALTLPSVYGFIFMQGLALVFMILIIIATLKDPGKE
jgi:hypothetical protein